MAGIHWGYIYPNNVVGLVRGSYVHNTDWGKGTERAIDDEWPTLKDLPGQDWTNPDCIFGAYPKSWAIGFINGNTVWVTDWNEPKTLAEQWPSLPQTWQQSGGITQACVFPNGVVGLIKNGLVHHTDWGDGKTVALPDQYKGLPTGWNIPDCVFGAYPKSWAIGFIKKNEVWVTDWNEPKTLAEQWPDLPSDWTE